MADYNICYLTVEQVQDFFGIIKDTWDEVDQRKGLYELNPDFGKYMDFEASDYHSFLGCFDGETLVGYFSFFVTEMLHCKGEKILMGDVIYCNPNYRGTGVLDLLLQEAEDAAKEEGVKFSSINLKCGDNCLERLGYTPQEVVYQKRL